jgi:hypothetical protein
MVALHSIILFDASVVVIMLIIAYLSRRIGEALKIKPYYRILYVTSLVIALTALGDIVLNDVNIHINQLIPMGLRLASTCTAFFVSLRYWSWAFSEYLRK